MLPIEEMRASKLNNLCQMVINDTIVYKWDHIATIYINARMYFNVFRRYNSPYNIMIEDSNYDIYLHQDHTIRTSLKTILMLSDADAQNMYTHVAYSYKHAGPVPSLSKDLADMRWTELQANYQSVSVDFCGIFNEYVMPVHLPTPHELAPTAANNGYNEVFEIKSEPPSTPNQPIMNNLVPPPLERVHHFTDEDKQAANILLSLSIPRIENPFELRESDGPSLSMRFSGLAGRKRPYGAACYCIMDDDDNDYDDADDDADDEYDESYKQYEEDIDENNYIVLRNGVMIPKRM
jgi:hypothetical protein